MDLQKMLGFPVDQVRIDPDGASTPPEISPLSPPTKPGVKHDARLLQATRMEGLAPPHPAVPPVPAPVPVPAAPATAPSPRSRLTTRLRALFQSAGQAPGSTERWLLIAASTALIGFGAALLGALLLRGSAGEAPAPARPRAAERSTPAAAIATPLAAHEPCARQREPQLVARSVASNFQIDARARPGGVDVLLGLSAGGGTALGLELNATTLAVSELLRDSGARELLGVVPTPSTAPGFAVDRASVGGFREWRTLPDRPGWALTRTNRAINLTERSTQRSTPLWPLGAEEEISRPRLEWGDAEQLAMVLRRGGRQGKLVVGWLDPSSGEHSPLRELPFEGTELGLPSLATRGGMAAIAAAARSSSSAPWHVELTSSERLGRTRRILLIALEPGPERESFAPSLTALADGRWFLQWTEGQQRLRRVRGVTLDSEFAALGEPIVLSPAGASAGGGHVVSVDEGLLSLFLIQRGTNYELWAAPLACR